MERERARERVREHDTWTNSQLQALAEAHAILIQDYKCAEWRSQDPAIIHFPAAPTAGQAPQATTPLLIPRLNQLAQLAAVETR